MLTSVVCGKITFTLRYQTQAKELASQPWHYTAGAVHLARELCSVAPKQVAALLPALADVARLTHFPQTDSLRETLWKSVPVMANGMGNKAFNARLDAVLEPLYATLTRASTPSWPGSQRWAVCST